MSEVLGTLFKYLLAVLGIAAIVLIFYEALGSNKVGTEVSNITTLQANANQLYATNTSNTSLTDAVLIAAGDAPSSMVSGTTLVNPWGGAVTITGQGTTTTIVDAALPQSACSKEATTVSNYTSITINGGTALTSPADPGTVATECVAGSANSITFVFNN